MLDVVLFLVFLVFLRMSAQLDPGWVLLFLFLEMLSVPILSHQIFVKQFSILWIETKAAIRW